MSLVILPDLPLWLWSLLCIAGLAGGMALHLAFHPLRQDFSDALDLLKNQPRLLLLAGLFQYAHLASESDGFHPLPLRLADEWTHWSALAPALLEESASRFATLLHQILPPWPAVLLLPFLLALSLWNLSRHPYRAGLRHRPRGRERALLFSLLAASSLLSITTLSPSLPDLPEALESLLLAVRILCLALLTAGCQLGALRVACLWLRPPVAPAPPLLVSAWWDVLGRWPLLLSLAAFDASWIALQSWSSLSPSHLATWLLIEMLLFFAPFPVAAALAPPGAGFLSAGAHSLRILRRSLLPLLGLALTSVTILALAHYAVGLLGALLSPRALLGLALQAFLAFPLAFVHIWLFLAAAFLLLRHGASSASPPDPTARPA